MPTSVYDSAPFTDLQDASDALAMGPSGQLAQDIKPLLLLGGTILVLGMVSAPDGAKVGQAGTDYSKYILPVGLVLGAYLILKKFGILGPNATSSDNAQTTAQVQATTTAALKQAAAAGDIQTVPDTQLQAAADDLYTQGISGTPDQDQMVYDVIRANTLTDLLRLIQLFGTRNVNTGGGASFCAILRVDCTAVDLPTFLKGFLDQTHISTINSYLADQKINYSF